MAKKLVLNHKIIFLIPRLSNEYIQYPIILLNNQNINLTDINSIVLDKKYEVAILITKNNQNQVDDDIYYFPITNEIIEDFKSSNFKEVIINNGYLDNFTEKDNILISCATVNE